MRNGILKLFLACCLFSGCVDKELADRLQKEVKQAQNEVIIYKNYILSMQDSINYYKSQINTIQQYKDSITDLGEELFVAKYKLERIKEYSDIVGKDKSQMTFYRGWILRVLNN